MGFKLYPFLYFSICAEPSHAYLTVKFISRMNSVAQSFTRHLGLCVSKSQLVNYNLLVSYNFLISPVGLCSHSISWLHSSPLYTPAKKLYCVDNRNQSVGIATT